MAFLFLLLAAMLACSVSGFFVPALHPVSAVQSTSHHSSSLCMQQSSQDPGFAPGLSPLKGDDYIAMGLSCSFSLNEDNKLDEYWVIEPLTAGTLECITLGVKTSYKRVLGLNCGQLFQGDPAEPTAINVEALQPLMGNGIENINFCDEVLFRSQAAARTYRRRLQSSELLAVGEMKDKYNFNIERKRIVNENYTPSDSDNVKQDMSIDVYGRSSEEEMTASQIKELENA